LGKGMIKEQMIIKEIKTMKEVLRVVGGEIGTIEVGEIQTQKITDKNE
jgi:hypothetical protein